METIHIILIAITVLAIFAGVAVTILYAAKRKRAAEHKRRHPDHSSPTTGDGPSGHGHGHSDHGPDVEKLKKEAAQAAKGRGIGKFFILIGLIVLGAVLVFAGVAGWILALLVFIAIYFVIDAVFGPVSKWVIVGFLVLGALLVTSMFWGRPVDLTHFQNRVLTKQSEEEKSIVETPSRELPGVAMMTITPFGSFYTNLVPGVVYNVSSTINSVELIVKAGDNEILTGPKNPLVVQNISSKKSSYWFTKERCRTRDSAAKAISVLLTPIRWEDAQ